MQTHKHTYIHTDMHIYMLAAPPATPHTMVWSQLDWSCQRLDWLLLAAGSCLAHDATPPANVLRARIPQGTYVHHKHHSTTTGGGGGHTHANTHHPPTTGGRGTYRQTITMAHGGEGGPAAPDHIFPKVVVLPDFRGFEIFPILSYRLPVGSL